MSSDKNGIDKNKLIDITKYLKQRSSINKEVALDVLHSLETEYAENVIEFILEYALTELKVGLGLIDPPEDLDIEDLHIFNKIADIYEQAAGNCYFCSESIDPNEDEFNIESKLCPICKLKVANIAEFLGVPAKKLFGNLPPRPQKTKIKFED